VRDLRGVVRGGLLTEAMAGDVILVGDGVTVSFRVQTVMMLSGAAVRYNVFDVKARGRKLFYLSGLPDVEDPLCANPDVVSGLMRDTGCAELVWASVARIDGYRVREKVLVAPVVEEEKPVVVESGCFPTFDPYVDDLSDFVSDVPVRFGVTSEIVAGDVVYARAGCGVAKLPLGQVNVMRDFPVGLDATTRLFVVEGVPENLLKRAPRGGCGRSEVETLMQSGCAELVYVCGEHKETSGVDDFLYRLIQRERRASMDLSRVRDGNHTCNYDCENLTVGAILDRLLSEVQSVVTISVVQVYRDRVYERGDWVITDDMVACDESIMEIGNCVVGKEAVWDGNRVAQPCVVVVGTMTLAVLLYDGPQGRRLNFFPCGEIGDVSLVIDLSYQHVANRLPVEKRFLLRSDIPPGMSMVSRDSKAGKGCGIPNRVLESDDENGPVLVARLTSPFLCSPGWSGRDLVEHRTDRTHVEDSDDRLLRCDGRDGLAITYV